MFSTFLIFPTIFWEFSATLSANHLLNYLTQMINFQEFFFIPWMNSILLFFFCRPCLSLISELLATFSSKPSSAPCIASDSSEFPFPVSSLGLLPFMLDALITWLLILSCPFIFNDEALKSCFAASTCYELAGFAPEYSDKKPSVFCLFVCCFLNIHRTVVRLQAKLLKPRGSQIEGFKQGGISFLSLSTLHSWRVVLDKSVLPLFLCYLLLHCPQGVLASAPHSQLTLEGMRKAGRQASFF